jgi:subtilisin family serine protease
MNSSDEFEGPDSGPVSDDELARRSRVSPHLRAAVMDWQRRREEAQLVGQVPPPAPVVRVLIELRGEDTSELKGAGVDFEHMIGPFCTANIALDRLAAVAELPTILRIHHEREPRPALDDSIPDIEVDRVRNAQFPFSGTDKFTGQGAVVGIIDSGINYLHPVFRLPNNPSKSRILAILDQTVSPSVTFTRDQIEAAIASNTELIAPGQIVGGLRVKTHNNDHTHGTHVAGIAAGNGKIAGNCHGEFKYVGVAPEAHLVVVKYGFDGAASLLAAIQFCANTAATVTPDGAPCVINMSFGASLGPHDGTDPYDKIIDNYLLVRSLLSPPLKPVVLVAAAGNSGGHQDGSVKVNGEDSHAAGNVPPGGASYRLRYQLPPELLIEAPGGQVFTRIEIRYTAPVGLGCRLIPPGNNITGNNLAAPNGNATFTENTQNSACRILSNIEDAAANKRRIYIEVRSAAGKLNQRGEWVIELTNASAAAIAYHAWITGPQFERFKNDLLRANTIDSPGSSSSVITVGNYCSTGKSKGKIDDSSGRGPRIDNVQKPDIVAPGVDICSAKRDFHQGCCCDCCCDSYTDETGTSMAAPHVTGAIALMLQRNPALTHQEIKTILLSKAFRDSFTGVMPNNDYGNGKLRILALLNDPLVRGAGTVITSSAPAPRPQALTSHNVGPAPQDLPPLPELVEGTPLWRLLNTKEGQKLYYRGLEHWEEARALVNSNRRIAIVWHRNHGPMLLHHMTRTVMLPHVALPREWEGEEISVRAARLVSALELHASRELVRAMHETLPLIAQLQGKSLLEVVEMFETNEEERVHEHA